MELSRLSPAPARYTGIGIVIAVHVVAITALSLAFIKPAPKHQAPLVFKSVPKAPEPPPQPLEPIKAREPVILPVPLPPIPTPTEPTITPEPTIFDPSAKSGPTTDGPVPTGTATVAPPVIPKTQPQVQRPGAVCSVMPRPEVPTVNWAGEAVLQVVATVRGGRVVGSEFRVTQGALDSKSRRALQRSVEAALAGYQCQGDAMFQQDFAFRLE
jgi:hypothetical protein